MLHIMLQLAATTTFVLAVRAPADSSSGSGGGSSPGCRLSSPTTLHAGAQATRTLRQKTDGTTRTYSVHVPASYEQRKPSALVLAFHGWGDSGWAMGDVVSAAGNAAGYLLVAPDGLGETNAGSYENRNSWNGGGTTQVPFPGPKGPTCNEAGVSEQGKVYCYKSCSLRPGGCHACDWTTCNDDIAFVSQLLDELETEFCIDPARVYATGFSNGATFTYALGASLPQRIRAIAPSSGTPLLGFSSDPVAAGQSVLDIHGDFDNTCPANRSTVSSDGWYYTTVDETLTHWLNVNGCRANPSHYPTSLDGQLGLFCVNIAADCQTRLVRCAWHAEHAIYPDIGKLIIEFFEPPPAHGQQQQQEEANAAQCTAELNTHCDGARRASVGNCFLCAEQVSRAQGADNHCSGVGPLYSTLVDNFCQQKSDR